MKMSEPNWYSMLSKYSGTCKECGTRYDVGDSILWCKGIGAKHQTCPKQTDDYGGLTIIDNTNDVPKFWKDPKKYPYTELQKIKNCQCCGIDIVKKNDSYIDDDRKVCVMCFGT